MSFSIPQGYSIIKHNNDTAICQNGIDTCICDNEGRFVIIPKYCLPLVAGVLCDDIFKEVYQKSITA